MHGGATRQASVRAGLEAIAADGGADLVLIHDAARPFVPSAMVDRVLDALAADPGATPALPVIDSLRRGEAHVDAEVDRAGLHRVQTPQGFASPKSSPRTALPTPPPPTMSRSLAPPASPWRWSRAMKGPSN